MSVETQVPQIKARLYACGERAAALWFERLVTLSPALTQGPAKAVVEQLVADLVALSLVEPCEATSAYALGERLESLDSLHPRDLASAQQALYDAFADCVPQADWAWLQPRMACILFGFGAGFYAGKSARASRFEMSSMSRMGHDLKTPLNAITGFSRVILKGIDGPVTDFQREDLTSIYEAGQRLLTMVNDLSTVQKHDAARTLLLETPFAVSELLADVLRAIQPIAGERGHTVSVTGVGSLGSVSADASTVRWVLLSLLFYVLRQGVDATIALRASRGAYDLSQLVFEVVYTPSGYRHAGGDVVRSSPDPAGDIGLITCQRFCEKLGGTLERKDGEGVTFTVNLPVGSSPA